MRIDTELINKLYDIDLKIHDFITYYQNKADTATGRYTDRKFLISKELIIKSIHNLMKYTNSCLSLYIWKTFIPDFLWYDKASLIGIHETDYEKINNEFLDLTKQRYSYAVQIREQIVSQPLPPEEPDDFQKIILNFDPSCTKIKKRLQQFANIINTVAPDKPHRILHYTEQQFLQELYFTYERAESYIERPPLPENECPEYWDRDHTLFVMGVQRFLNRNIPNDFEGIKEILKLTENTSVEAYSSNERAHFKEIYHIGSITSRILKYKYHLFAPTYQEAVSIVIDFIESFRSIIYINEYRKAGEELALIADQIDLPEHIKQVFRDCGNAISKEFDIRAIHYFDLYVKGRKKEYLPFEGAYQFLKRQEDTHKVYNIIRKLDDFRQFGIQYEQIDEIYTKKYLYSGLDGKKQHITNILTLIKGSASC
jgi:hypothetical protein